MVGIFKNAYKTHSQTQARGMSTRADLVNDT